jgi:hypothetical protein
MIIQLAQKGLKRPGGNRFKSSLKFYAKFEQQYIIFFKGTVSPDDTCLEVISIKSPLLEHVTPDI